MMSTDNPTWQPMEEESTSTTPTCVSCGHHVTRQFARVFGDNGDVVHACPNCSTYREMKTSDFIPQHRR